METITIKTKEYKALKAAKTRLETLLNKQKFHKRTKHIRLEDLVGILSDVKEFQGKTSVEVQHMIPELWNRKRS